MMTINEVRHALRDRNLSYVARMTGLSAATVWNIANDPERDAFVRYNTLKALSDYLEANP